MKKTNAPNRRMGRMIAKNLIILLTLVIVAFVGMWAWFTNRTQADANGLEVRCEAPDGVEIAVVEHDADPPEDSEYSTSIVLDDKGILSKLLFTEITGDGVTFYRPALFQQNGYARPRKDTDWREAVPGEDYICFDLYMRTKSPKNIYLSSTSSFLPNASKLSWDSTYTPSGSDNASTYGDFSRDALVGASRASVVGYDSSSKKYTDNRLLWITRPDICLMQDGENYSLITKITEENDQYGSHSHYYWTSDKVQSTVEDAVPSVLDLTRNTVTLGQNIQITSFDSVKDGAVYEDGYWYVHVVYNTWIEGEDSEARLALSDGKFKINLDLCAESN